MRKLSVFGIISAIISVIALVSASSACIFILHQPKTPKCLR